MSKPVTVRNTTDTDVVFRDRAGVRAVVPAGGTAEVHRDDLEYLRGREVREVRAESSSDKAPTSISAARARPQRATTGRDRHRAAMAQGKVTAPTAPASGPTAPTPDHAP